MVHIDGHGPQPSDSIEEAMKIIWENENPRNKWQRLIWNEYPLSDWESEAILKRLRKTVMDLQEAFPNGIH